MNTKTNNKASSSTSSSQEDDSNRLAPYNPTHATAQSNALDLLELTPRDVFFDLGCGDGRLVVAALERCYDDDFLMRVHQERFARLQLSHSQDNGILDNNNDISPPRVSHQHQQQQQQYRQQQFQHQQQYERRYSQNSQSDIDRSDSTRKVFHTRSHSDYSVPHLMRDYDMDDSDLDISVDNTPNNAVANAVANAANNAVDNAVATSYSDKTTTNANATTPVAYKIPHHHHHQHNNDNVSQNQEENSSLGLSSVLSPQLSSQQQIMASGTLTPATPVTPVVSNIRLSYNIDTVNNAFRILQPPPVLNSGDYGTTGANNNNNQQHQHQQYNSPTSENYEIPKTIETPSPDEQSRLTLQISELPTDSSILLQDVLATVPSGGSMPDDDDDDDEGGSSIRNNNNDAPPNNETNHSGDAVGGAAAAASAIRSETFTGIVATDEGPGGAPGGGLQCVGIEYNQALAESAQSNVRKSYIYPHVERKVCIRWGDVLEEWNRGGETSDDHHGHRHRHRHRHGGEKKEDDDLRSSDLVGAVSVRRSHHCDDADSNDGCDAGELTLLRDATAVFVYLLPQGLKKVRPLLYEAAVRRRRERQRQREQYQRQQQQRQRQLPQQEIARLQHPLQQQPLREFENSAGVIDAEDGTSCPLPRQLVHRKDFSHASDVTDCDFFRTGSIEANHGGGMEGIREISNAMQMTLFDEGGDVTVPKDVEIPSFRVVSYMFSIPGWTPAKVDRSSKGGCALYLYENVHEEAE
mmetsp:Transcript_35650/g.65985  ORF Transcript_35650/g.65985 Transcript_35650/m.65985 type:complete len:750 (+) Transcript_35650:90-2339(+)